MMIFSLVAMTGLEKCCITSAYLQWLCHSGERPVARGPLVFFYASYCSCVSFFDCCFCNSSSFGALGMVFFVFVAFHG